MNEAEKHPTPQEVMALCSQLDLRLDPAAVTRLANMLERLLRQLQELREIDLGDLEPQP